VIKQSTNELFCVRKRERLCVCVCAHACAYVCIDACVHVFAPSVGVVHAMAIIVYYFCFCVNIHVCNYLRMLHLHMSIHTYICMCVQLCIFLGYSRVYKVVRTCILMRQPISEKIINNCVVFILKVKLLNLIFILMYLNEVCNTFLFVYSYILFPIF